MKEGIKNLKNYSVYQGFYSIYKTMLLYCLRCSKNTGSENPKAVKTKSGRVIRLSKCAVCDSKESKFIKE